jgi:uncharacterized glyoxalase superfamily protein PhnB
MKITDLVPMLETNNLEQTVEFYAQNLGFVCKGFYPDEANACWASLWNGDSEIAFSLKDAQKPMLTGSIYLHVKNADELWELLKNKVEIVYPIENMSYGMREFGIRDCNGYVLNIGQDILGN